MLFIRAAWLSATWRRVFQTESPASGNSSGLVRPLQARCAGCARLTDSVVWPISDSRAFGGLQRLLSGCSARVLVFCGSRCSLIAALMKARSFTVSEVFRAESARARLPARLRLFIFVCFVSVCDVKKCAFTALCFGARATLFLLHMTVLKFLENVLLVASQCSQCWAD